VTAFEGTNKVASIVSCSLRSAYPSSEASSNTGFVWSPSVAHQELQQGLGVSVKVTVISDHFREPLTFTCDGKAPPRRTNWCLLFPVGEGGESL